MIEALIGASVLAIALLGHGASLFTEHKLGVEGRARSAALQTMDQFMERLRSEEEFPTLFDRLLTLQEASLGSPKPAQAWFEEVLKGYGQNPVEWTGEGDPTDEVYATLLSCSRYRDYLAAGAGGAHPYSGHVTLRDGRLAFRPDTYFPNFSVPRGLKDFHVVVEVPAAPLTGLSAGGATLREDIPFIRFGLPADLDGDGVLDSQSHRDDYGALPVSATFRWTTTDGSVQEMWLCSWLWGQR